MLIVILVVLILVACTPIAAKALCGQLADEWAPMARVALYATTETDYEHGVVDYWIQQAIDMACGKDNTDE